jgi:hypothetical protein
MSRKKRYLWIGCGLLLLLGVEIGLNALRAPVASVRVVNDGPEPIEGLHAVCGSSEGWVSRIESGASALVPLSGRRANALKLTYRQKGNAMSAVEIPAFDPEALSKEGFLLVIRIKTNEYERYQDDAEPSRWGRIASNAKRWLEEALEAY